MEKTVEKSETEITEDMIKEALNKIKGSASPKELKIQEEALRKVYLEGLPVHEAMGISEESMEFIYAHAYSLYNSGKYTDALQIFYILNFLNDKEVKYCFSIAACQHMLKKYPEAMGMYMICQIIERENPLLMWHIADCYIQMGKKMNALLTLKLCKRFAEADAAYESLKIRAEEEIKILERELDEEFSKTKKK